MPAPVLKPQAVREAARAIRRERFMACTVTDEQLVERVLAVYQAARPARPRGRAYREQKGQRA